VAVQCLVSVVGLAGLLRARRPGVPWALLVSYASTLTLLYAVSHIETRYHLPVMAALLIGAGLWCGDARQWLARSLPPPRAVLLALAAAAASALLWWLAGLTTRPRPALVLHHAAVLGGAGALFLFFVGMAKGEGRGARVAAAGSSGGAAASRRAAPGRSPRTCAIGLVALRPGGARLEWETAMPSESRDTWVAFRAESGRGGEGLLRVGGGRAGPEIGFPLASRQPFTRESAQLRLSYVPERLGEDRAEGLYLLRVPASLVRAGEPLRLSAWLPTRLSTDERYFAVRPTPVSAEARRALGPGGSESLLEGFGRFLDATRNSYPGDTGPWEIAVVY